MKYLLAIIIFTFALSSVSALTLDIKSSYQPRETLITEIQGTILEPIDKSDITFLRGHVEVPFEYDLKKLGDSYFIYAIMPSTENNYTLRLNDIATTVNGEQTTLTQDYNLSVTGETSAYTLSPGIILTTSDVELTIFLNRDISENIPIGFQSESTFTLQPGNNILDISIEDIDQGLYSFTVGQYVVPFYIARPLDRTTYVPRYVSLAPRRINAFFDGPRHPLSFHITNTGTSEIRSISFEYDDSYYSIYPRTRNNLDVNETVYFNISVLREDSFSDSIRIIMDNETIDLPVDIEYMNEESPNPDDQPNQTGYDCSELGGFICQEASLCSGDVLPARDGICCNVPCQEKTSSVAWIGYILGLAVLIILIIIGGRYLKAGSIKIPFIKRAE